MSIISGIEYYNDIKTKWIWNVFIFSWLKINKKSVILK
jgi:hypothetical protein